MTRYLPARHYYTFGVLAMSLAIFSGWVGFRWTPAFIPCVLFALSSTLMILLAFRPAIEIQESGIVISGKSLPWMDIHRLDRTGWISPLVVRVTLFDDSRFLLVYPGDLESCKSLLRQLRRYSRDALIDGIPYRQYWGEMLAPNDRRQPVPRYRVLRPEDEADVERLYQRLKTVGNLDQKSTDEN
ncbi:MAG: hypothetical protein EXQ52_09875 [Bryobacterales bacterium]|nr:hypothetical protein [Bryobacterales bacterium]